MPVFAAIDIGSNSVRLSIARLQSGRLVPLHQDREVTRLGEGVFRSATLEPQAMAATVKVLRRFHRSVQSYGADRVRVVATSAMRDAKNSKVFGDLVKSATGWRMEVISGLEEGRLIHLGVLSSTRVRARRLLLLDLGGGSCELTVSSRSHIQSMVSLPLGAVRLTQEFLHHDPPKAHELERMQEFIDEEIGRVARQISAAHIELTVATSGTAAAIAKAAGNSSGKGLAVRTSIVALAKKVAGLKRAQREALPGVNAKRAEIIVAGAAVFATIFSRCGLKGFRYSPLGLRDGILAQMAADHDKRARSRKQIESDRWDALVAACKHYRVDMGNAMQVRKLSLELFRVLRPVHQLPAEFSEWLSAAAMLHEVGLYVNRAGRHRHTHYIIAHSEIFGYTEAQRAVISAIARYQGNTKPHESDRIMRRIPVLEQKNVIKAVALLRMAGALDHGNRSAVRGVAGRVNGAVARLRLRVARGGAELELWALEKEFGYFREVFGRELEVALV
jgi:exopolyphosphatase/guanosine-5'-triphosphate,3'-diphosphate pyrophosphatase